MVSFQKKLNIDQVKAVGDHILEGMIRERVSSYLFGEKDRVTIMESKSKIKIDGKDIHIDP